MAKLIIPKSNERERAIFEKHNIRLVESMTPEEFETVAIEFLNTHNVLHLATCKDNIPRSTPLEYFNNGLTVFILSEGGGKIANLKTNSKVSFSISDPYNPVDNFFSASGLQVWGTASTFKRNDRPEKAQEIYRHYRHASELKKQGLDTTAGSFNFNIISIIPDKITYLNLLKGFRNVTWNRQG